MRQIALFAGAFSVGLMGAMSQQGVAPQVRVVHEPAADMSALSPMAVIPLRQMAALEKAIHTAPPAAPAAAHATANDFASEAKAASPAPKAKPRRIAKKAKAKPEIALAPEPEQHSFWYRLFHKTDENPSRVAAASTNQ